MLLAEQNIVINNVEYNLDTMTPVIEEKSDSNNNVNENRIIIISNVDILAAGVANGSSNIPGIDPSHMFNSPGSLEKYNQNTVPKLVPITNRAYNHNNGVELSNGTENEVTDEEHEKSPKVFIIDKSGGESDVTIGGVSNVCDYKSSKFINLYIFLHRISRLLLNSTNAENAIKYLPKSTSSSDT